MSQPQRKPYVNVSRDTLKTPAGKDWPPKQVASLTDDEARADLAYGKIQPVASAAAPGKKQKAPADPAPDPAPEPAPEPAPVPDEVTP